MEKEKRNSDRILWGGVIRISPSDLEALRNFLSGLSSTTVIYETIAEPTARLWLIRGARVSRREEERW